MDSNLKEILWPPNGLIFDQEFMLPAFCKPKLAPLKSAMDLEKMQKNALEKLKDLQAKEIEMNAEAEAVEKKVKTLFLIQNE